MSSGLLEPAGALKPHRSWGRDGTERTLEKAAGGTAQMFLMPRSGWFDSEWERHKALETGTAWGKEKRHFRE